MNLSLKIAHISDPHLTSLDHVKWDDLLNKRILGYLSWRLKRRLSHNREMLSHTLADLTRRQPDHLIISGDFTQLGTAAECRETGTWLNGIGAPDYISIVPGNHDHYVSADFDGTTGQWLAYMQSDPNGPGNTNNFPYLRVRGPVAIIGLSTAIPSAPFFATGKLGDEQLHRLYQLLEITAQRSLYRIIVLHHGPQPGAYSYRRRLVDAHRLLPVLDEQGAELVIHGHGHRQVRAMLRTSTRLIPVFGVPSASACYANPGKKAGYNVYEVNKTPSGWLTHVESSVFNTEEQKFETNFSQVFSSPDIWGQSKNSQQ